MKAILGMQKHIVYNLIVFKTYNSYKVYYKYNFIAMYRLRFK